mgnify:CR=1 FL=1
MNTQTTTDQVREPFNKKVLRYSLTSKTARQTWSAKRRHRTI